MTDIAIASFAPSHFLDTDFDVNAAIENFNKFLELDGYKLQLVGKKCKVSELDDFSIDLSHPYEDSEEIAHIFIKEQIEKCDRKLVDGDFEGAITNARSLVEAVLCEIEKEFDPNSPKYDGDLPKLYKRVQKHLNLSPGQENLPEFLKQILSGLTNIIKGLAGLRNKMSDAHPISYKPSEHHAKLAVNSAKTLCQFLFETKEYQTQNKNSST